ncbi:MAG: XdhC/CoxI family protein, partial [Acidobacteriota bacterium]
MSAGLYPDLLEELVARRRGGERVVLATVVAARGSTPRAPGARMLVLADGTILGTVGGGVKESEVIAAALELHRRGGCRKLALDFEAGLRGEDGPICGGAMEVFMERIDPTRRVAIAGAGHIAHSLHRFVGVLGLHTIVLDERPELATSERFPGARLVVAPFAGALSGLGLTGNDAVVIVTPQHSHDLVVLRDALATPAGYIGMIGSATKVRTVLNSLRQEGLAEEQIARVHAPIGLDIGAETPAEIALAIAAEIVAVATQGTARRSHRGSD